MNATVSAQQNEFEQIERFVAKYAQRKTRFTRGICSWLLRLHCLVSAATNTKKSRRQRCARFKVKTSIETKRSLYDAAMFYLTARCVF